MVSYLIQKLILSKDINDFLMENLLNRLLFIDKNKYRLLVRNILFDLHFSDDIKYYILYELYLIKDFDLIKSILVTENSY